MTLELMDHRNKRYGELLSRLRMLEDAIENVRHGLCLFDSDGRIAFCNRRYPEVIGLPPELVQPGLTVRELIEMAMKEGYYEPDRTIDDIEAAFWDNLDCDRESPARIQRGGRTFVIHPGRTTLGNNLVATFEDISDRLAAEEALRQSESRLAAMLEAMPDCVKIFDENARLTYINRRGLEVLEVPDMETLQASGHSPVPAEYTAKCIDVHKRVLEGESIVWNYEIVGLKGTRRHVEAHTVPIDLPDGSCGVMSITRDVTERKKAEDDLRRSEERLRLVHEATGLADFENDGGEITYCSDRFFEQVGLPVGDNTISTWGLLELVHPEDREPLREEMERAINDDEIFDAEYRITRQNDGAVRWISCRTKLLRDAEGNITRTIGAHQDITDRKMSELALQESEQRLRLVQEATGLAEFWVEEGGLTHVSERLIDQLGLPEGTETLNFEKFLEYIHSDDRQILVDRIGTSLQIDGTFDCEFRILHGKTGEVRWIHSRTKMQRDASGKPVRSIGAHLDITDRKRAEEALRESEESFRLAAEAVGLGVWDYDPATDTRRWSQRLYEILGLPEELEPSVQAALDCIHPDDSERFLAMGAEAMAAAGSIKLNDSFRILRASDQTERWVALDCWKIGRSVSNLDRIIITFRDTTEERNAEERIRWSANHDTLTRLANRTKFQEKLDQITRQRRNSGKPVGLLLLDLDHFKEINDTLGHDAGDRLLRMFAERLNAVVRPGDVVARLGGDEFAIILSEVAESQRLEELSQSIYQRLRDPFVYKGQILDCRTSIGGAMFPNDGTTPAELMKNADMALYSAKNAGRSTSKMYDPAMRDEFERRTNMVHLARDAIKRDQILTYYQPKVDLRSRSVLGFEALLRWRAPGGQIRLPETLEAAFEDLDVAADLTDRMIEQAIADMRNWLDQGFQFGHVAINASAADFRRRDFAEDVLSQLERAEVPTSMFQLEVTETVFLGCGAEYVQNALAMFSSAGVHIALDDFGTGYASLRHLKQFPVDTIKIDRSFVRDMETDAGDDAIVRAVVNLGRNLGIGVVAEGIEEERHVERLLRYGCNVGQGFLFARAQPADAVASMLERNGPGLQAFEPSPVCDMPRRAIG